MVLIEEMESTFELPRVSGAVELDDFERAASVALDALRGPFELQEGERRQQETFFLETFDWRLHRVELTLSAARRAEGGFELFLAHGNSERPTRASVASLPGFSDELPEAMREVLAKPMSMRRLLPILGLRSQVLGARVLDPDGKTVVRARFEQAEVVPGEAATGGAGGHPLGRLSARLVVRSVVGYGSAYERVRSHVEKELGWKRIEKSPLEEALSLAGREPRDYSSKVRIPLRPSQTAAEAARSIHLSLLRAMQANETGTRLDLDSEFLHDFRVAVRRTRSALTQIKGVFPPAELEHFRGELSWLGSCTGPTRDLDVYLLKFDRLQAALPEAAARDLEPLRSFLEATQKLEQKRLVEVLGSERYRALIQSWHRFLTHPPACSSELCPNASRPAMEVARERIWKIYRRIVKKGRTVHADTPVEVLHEIRIDGKKLRYLLEFFSGFFPGGEIAAPIKALKSLQDNLGDLNDYEVQSLRLGEFARELFEEGKTPVETFLAMGRLTHHLDEGKMEEKRKFEAHFESFDSVENRALYRNLFKASRKG